LAWARKTGGRLSQRERQHLQRQLVERQVQALARQNERVREAIRHFDLDAVKIPDSALARKAEQHAAELSTEALLNHCHRTYLWGSLLAQADGRAVDDPELLYVACLLHDLGATEAHFGKDRRAHCFAVEGGFAAEAFLLGQGLDRSKAENVAEAIVLHINAVVEAERGPVAVYLSAGALCDVLGYRAPEIPDATARRVLRRHPGLDIASQFSAFVMREAALRPESRAAASVATMGEDAPLFSYWAGLERERLA
jgi:cyanamide hydratase family protein with HD domain